MDEMHDSAWRSEGCFLKLIVESQLEHIKIFFEKYTGFQLHKHNHPISLYFKFYLFLYIMMAYILCSNYSCNLTGSTALAV